VQKNVKNGPNKCATTVAAHQHCFQAPGVCKRFFIGRAYPSFLLPSSLLPSLFSLPFSLRIRPATPPSDFFHFPLLLSSFLFHMVSSALSSPADVSCPARSGAEPHPKSNLVHFSFKICHLVAGYAVGLQYAVKKHWKGRMCSLPCQSRSWYRATALPASYVPVSLSGPRRESKKSPRIVSGNETKGFNSLEFSSRAD